MIPRADGRLSPLATIGISGRSAIAPFAVVGDNLLTGCMKRAILVGLVALSGCTSTPGARCEVIDRLSHQDAETDAEAAFARGDNRLLMVGGLSGSVPNGQSTSNHRTRLLDGTSDTTTDACRRERHTAEAYAAKYNAVIAKRS